MPRASNNEPLTYIVASWTTLQIPLARTIEAENTEDGKHWLSLMHCHTPSGRPGFLRAVFGRVKEDPETVWFVTGKHYSLMIPFSLLILFEHGKIEKYWTSLSNPKRIPRSVPNSRS
jgi:hypothetical protein